MVQKIINEYLEKGWISDNCAFVYSTADDYIFIHLDTAIKHSIMKDLPLKEIKDWYPEE